MDLVIDGFDYHRIPVNGASLRVAVCGSGSPLLLLHGFPQHHLAWRHVAPALADRHTVVCADLRGYGASRVAVGADHSKRAMAADAVGLMAALGHERFAVAGHDRGALVAFRLGLDHPTAVTHVATVGVIPGVDMWDALHGVAGVFAWHLAFLAQPGELPQRLIAADPDTFFGHFLDQWSESPQTISDDVRRAYLAALGTADGIRGVCEDYRAGAFVDPDHDAADRTAGRRLAMPVLAVWEDPGDVELPFDPAAVWRSWADDLRTLVLPGGHFLPEAQPSELAAAIGELLRRAPASS